MFKNFWTRSLNISLPSTRSGTRLWERRGKEAEWFFKVEFFRLIEYLGLKGTFKGHPVQPPCNEQGPLLLDQVGQSPIQPDLECVQRRRIHPHSGQPVPIIIVKNFFLMSSLNGRCFGLKSLPLDPVLV